VLVSGHGFREPALSEVEGCRKNFDLSFRAKRIIRSRMIRAAEESAFACRSYVAVIGFVALFGTSKLVP
jgi:hypothetical protein